MTAPAAGRKLPTYVTLEHAAQITEQSVKTIRRRIADGILPAYRFGGRNIRIRLDDLEAAARLIPAVRTWKENS
jgi:excisionase family DNA binding protein